MIGVIGVGNMGLQIARQLASAGQAVLAFDRRAEALAAACQNPGISAAPDVANVVERCGTVITMLPDGSAVQQVVEGEMMPFLRAGMLLVDMSTSHPAVSRTLAARLKEIGVDFADGPVSGGIYSAREGALTVYLGAELRVAERVREVLAPVARQIFHMGPPGTGHVMKVLNNLVSMSTLVLTTEAVVLGRRQGLDVERIIECLNSGSARSYASEVKYPRAILTGTYDTLGPMRMLYKDVNIAMDLAESSQSAVPTCQAALELWKVAMAVCGPESDQTEVYRFFCRLYGMEER